ncbi:methylated-DNA--[protein]-cysteine S-methyltransferase [Maridesulfovibrio frigidus]|uniref:methylated-DNA--[protein]-cysteine S-methyltransferase n=1 Tax=Maridesulfovibrio frigidus TaxID=340956 RepID=UPI0004E1BF9D|nr:methylated-DNA--[protein]-cysteine S-methyltransferase [Maridesulfovibrio frigidus]
MFHTEFIAAEDICIRLFWQDGMIRKIKLNWADSRESDPNLSSYALKIQSKLAKYVRGEKVEWPDLPLDFSQLTPFRQQVLKALSKEIKWGVATSYKDLSKLAGSPRAARAVGTTMANNPFPLIIPCHRVLAAGEKIGGFSGSGIPMKEYLLNLEKISFKNG